MPLKPDSVPAPNLRTPPEALCKEEQNKLASEGYIGGLKRDFQDASIEDIVWESEQLAKSHGIYLEFNRDKTGDEKEWIYMIRFSIPGGGPISREQWRIFDECAEQYTASPSGQPSIRLTTRQNIQFHWVRKKAIRDIVQRIAETRFYSLNGCGDNTRNVMGCPLGRFSTVSKTHELAVRAGEYFRLPIEPHLQIFGINPNHERTPGEHFHYGPGLLNRKFKIAIAAAHADPDTGRLVADNCVECRTNDIGIAPVIENGKIERYQVYIGGGQGEKNGKPTFAALGRPLAVFHEKDLLGAMDAIVRVHQEWGDRQNRFWARLKYVVHAQGTDWYRDRVRELMGDCLEMPDESHDVGPRHLHHGWIRQSGDDLWTFGAFIENGRIINGPDGELKTMVRHLMDTFPVSAMITPNQDLLFTDVPGDAKARFESEMKRFGYGLRHGAPFSRLRRVSVACVGLPTCRLSYTDSEQFQPELIDELEKRGWGDMAESVGVSGCERQCSRPGTKTVGWVGSGKDRYQIKIGGSEDGRHQGDYLVDESGKMQLRFVKREQVADVTEVLFDHYKANRADSEDMGGFLRRIGPQAVIDHLKEHPKTAALMK